MATAQPAGVSRTAHVPGPDPDGPWFTVIEPHPEAEADGPLVLVGGGPDELVCAGVLVVAVARVLDFALLPHPVNASATAATTGRARST